MSSSNNVFFILVWMDGIKEMTDCWLDDVGYLTEGDVEFWKLFCHCFTEIKQFDSAIE